MKNILLSIVLFTVLAAPAYSTEQAKSTTTERFGAPDISQLNQAMQLKKPTKGPAKVVSQAYESYVWFHSVDLYLSRDINNNGFYHRLEVEIDADTFEPYTQVFAEFSLKSSYGDEYIFYTSSIFELYGESSEDWLAIDTILEQDYPRDEYLLTIRLFDANSGYLVAEISGYDDINLDLLPLEDYQRDNRFPNSSVSVGVAAGSTGIVALFGLSLLCIRRKLV
ncbi:choice-of-anchor H family protein [Rheinheimera sp. WS51]|uniref:choice-of-anchor H family protein n=1 Tax=Rheinheimera sp. WS51 TaxID=3425886 RepID=UPI003D8F09D0